MASDWTQRAVDRRDYRGGAVGEEDFSDEFRHKKKSARDKSKKKRGCPENEFGPHIYVWTTEPELTGYFIGWSGKRIASFHEENGFFRREHKICCGCGKKLKSRYTEEMENYLKSGRRPSFYWEEWVW